MTTALDAITRSLAEIQDHLLALEPGPSAKRYTLLLERDKLRHAAREYRSDWDDGRSNEDLELELEALQALRTKIVADRTGFVTSKGGNNQGPAAGAWVKLSQQALSSGKMRPINARISKLEDMLSERASGDTS